MLARAAYHRCGAVQVPNPHLSGLYRLVGEGLENLAKAQKIRPTPETPFIGYGSRFAISSFERFCGAPTDGPAVAVQVSVFIKVGNVVLVTS